MVTIEIPSDLVYDPFDPATSLDPHALFRRIRDEAPLYYDEALDFYALSRFEDVERGFVNRDVFISGRGVTLGILRTGMEIPPGTVLMEDPPSHSIHRSLLARMFTPKRVSALEPQIRQLCADLLDPVVGTGGFDLIDVLAKQMPMRVIGKLIGIPEADQEFVRDRLDDIDPEDRTEDDMLSGAVFADYIEWRADHPSDDIMTQLMNAEFEDETGTTRRLTRPELLAYVNIVALAGNETTARLIGWAGKLLADHPDQRRALVEDRSLVPNAIEEILRFEPPPLQSSRYVAKDIELYGHTVPAGSIIAFLIPAANRDPDHHADPDRFDVQRPPGGHFSFGFASHYCLGQALARLEARVALEELLARFPEWDVDASGAQYDTATPELRGWNVLPLVTP
jgi:cytochrome P450